MLPRIYLASADDYIILRILEASMNIIKRKNIINNYRTYKSNIGSHVNNCPCFYVIYANSIKIIVRLPSPQCCYYLETKKGRYAI